MLGAGLLAEAAAVDEQRVLLGQHFFHEAEIVFGDVEFRVGVERAFGCDAADARRAVAPVDGELAAAAQLCRSLLSGDPENLRARV